MRELTTEIQQLKDALKRSEERIPRSTSGEKRGGHIVSGENTRQHYIDEMVSMSSFTST